MKVVIPDYIDIDDDSRNKLVELGVKLYDDVPDTQGIIERIKDAEIITANYIDITREIIDSAPKLKYIVVPAVGYEWIDTEYATEKGVKVLNCPTHNGLAVAELATALTFAVLRKVVDSQLSLRSGKWEPKKFRGTELSGKTLGIVGYGKIGKRIESLLTGFDLKVLKVSTKSPSSDWEELLTNADIICICLPLSESTKHIIDAEKIAKLKSSAVIINVGRGATIDTSALYKALQAKKIAGAGLDVYEDEPLSGIPSEKIVSFSNLDNVVAVPHIGYNTVETSKRLGFELLGNIESCLSSEPLNVVN